ncbi:MAG: DUF4382 domain-containing protein [Cyanobacteria bacterium P01_D01_bin.44]
MFTAASQRLIGLGLGTVAIYTVTACSPSQPTGTLEIRANGEDFVRQGFVTKDGWQITFDQVMVTLSEVTAYQTEPPFDPEQAEPLQAATLVTLDEPVEVDLAAGDETAEPILIEAVDAPAGRFNALSWSLMPAPLVEAPMTLMGTATKADQTILFELALAPSLKFTCGDFIGDERKGILEPNETADVEATFHFDHLFGDAELPADDPLNQKALGFDPFAELATDGSLEAAQADLQQQLSEADYGKLQTIFSGLGHVGEGHCKAERVEVTERGAEEGAE